MMNSCVCCGEIIPEGRQVCPNCEAGIKVERVMTLQDLEPLSRIETKIVSRLATEDEAVMAILNRRKFLRENEEYIDSLCKIQRAAMYAPRNEKETATLPILYEEDV